MPTNKDRVFAVYNENGYLWAFRYFESDARMETTQEGREGYTYEELVPASKLVSCQSALREAMEWNWIDADVPQSVVNQCEAELPDEEERGPLARLAEALGVDLDANARMTPEIRRALSKISAEPGIVEMAVGPPARDSEGREE